MTSRLIIRIYLNAGPTKRPEGPYSGHGKVKNCKWESSLPPPPVFSRRFSEKSLTQRGSNRPSASTATQGVFSTARPARSPERLHWPSLLAYDHMGFKEIKGLNPLSGPNPDCLNVGLMKPRRGSTRSGQKKTRGGQAPAMLDRQLLFFVYSTHQRRPLAIFF